MSNSSRDTESAVARITELYRSGVDPRHIELTEAEVFPYVLPYSPITGRKARYTGMLSGVPGPKYIKRGRSIRYRLSDLHEWLEQTGVTQ